MKIVKSTVLLLIAALVIGLGSNSEANALSTVPAACTKIKQSMVSACSRNYRSCAGRTNALNRCLKKAAFRPAAKSLGNNGLVCAMVYQPVCAQNSKGFFQIYSNSCVAANAGSVEAPFNLCSSK